MTNENSSGGNAALKDRFRHPLALVGAALAVVSLANILFLFLIDFMSARPSPYIGILAYMIMPGLLILGLLLIAAGVLLHRRRRLKPGAPPAYPRLDLNDPNQRSTFAFFFGFVVVFVMLSAVGSYRGYEYTDSVQFCGQLCHSVMDPEFTAYQLSPHARVRCVECHVGAGANWYVRSKLSGARQVFATAFHTFPRPIPTPVANLRPAPETCEECHWPKKFYGAQLKVFTHYSEDEKNTPRTIRMLIKTGGGDPNLGLATGIHWHMNIANEISYASTDKQRQAIPYVHVKDLQGNVTEYLAKDANMTLEQARKLPLRRMDCVDCHNRPTHVYVAPDTAVDQSLLARKIDASLPFIRQQAVSALTGKYDTTGKAMEGIATEIHKYYEAKYPDVEKTRQPELQSAIAEVQRIYRSTTFPEMKVDWRTHPNNIGHLYFPGCFRCHDGQHASPEGKVVRKDCDICHTVLGQEEGGTPNASIQGVGFKHPADIGDLSQVTCSDCHTGGVGP
jgi:hypothetical protein